KVGEIKDQQVKFHTILIQLNRRWADFPYSLSVKIEISTRGLLTKSQLELTVLQSVLDFPLISFQVEKKEILMADKIAALLFRNKARDLYDLLFLLTRKITPDLKRINQLTSKNWKTLDKVWRAILPKIKSFSQQEINTDLGPFLDKRERRLLPTLKENLISLIAQQSY
ncbi:MAG: nucleotidyl transferase AbiEii/AbiGii toxin family protein, partial [bacterium]